MNHLTETFCQAQVQIQSESIPGPFPIYFKSFQSIPIQNQIDLDQELMLFSLRHHHPPLNFSGADDEPWAPVGGAKKNSIDTQSNKRCQCYKNN